MRNRYFRQRWMPLQMGVLGLVLAVIFGWIAVEGLLHPEDGPTVRMAVPMYLFADYWVVAALVNMRSVWMTPTGIWTLVWPLPAVLPRYTPRQQMQSCFVRMIVNTDDGAVLESYFMVGVETKNERQIDLSGPHMDENSAWAAAAEIAGYFDRGRGEAALPIRVLPQTPSRRQLLARLTLVLFWSIVGFFTLYLGIAWDEQFQRERRDQRTVEPTVSAPRTRPRK